MKLYGCWGKIAYVNLSEGTVKVIEIHENDIKLFLGGTGLGAKILYELVQNPGSLDPLSPENPLILLTGPLTGTPFPSSGRFGVVAKSPLTGIFGESTAGGFWGPELKFAGFDGIVVIGRAKEPVYITIFDDEVSIRKAEHLWGKDTLETEEIIRKDHGDSRIKVACIGKGGENLVRFASIICDGGRAAGRCGLGAIMGSKKLKAIAVRGTKKVEYAHEDKLNEHCRELLRKVAQSAYATNARKYGTAGYVLVGYKYGDVPIKYWAKGTWDEIDKISGQEMVRKGLVKKPQACFNCPIACGRYVEITSGPYAGVKGHGPEYETVASIGSLCLLSDIEAIAKANELCTRYGLDTISLGSVIAFAMECYEKGLIAASDLGGIRLEWGNAEAVLKLIDLIANREGIGDILALGVKEASKYIKSSEEFAIHVKGLEVPMHDPRAWDSLALQYATMPRGACHTALAYTIDRGVVINELGFTKEFVSKLNRFSHVGKPRIVKIMQDYMGVFDCLVICKFLIFAGVEPSEIARALTYTTGWEFSKDKLLEIGERVFNLKRVFNVACGISRKDDTLPKRLLTPLSNGGAEGHRPNIEAMIDEYYRLRGWDKEGRPTKEKLKELQLLDIVERKKT